MTPAIILRVFVGIPVKRIIVARKRVKNVKLRINPKIMPYGRFLSPLTVPERTIGRIGRMQGDKMVTIPAKNANISKIIILLYILILLLAVSKPNKLC